MKNEFWILSIGSKDIILKLWSYQIDGAHVFGCSQRAGQVQFNEAIH